MYIKKIASLGIAAYTMFLSSTILLASHGISLDNELKYPADFKQFDYTSTKFIKGGSLTLFDSNGFDSFNPYTLKGVSPMGISDLVYETLGVSSLDEPFSVYGLIASDIKAAEDMMSVTYTINKNARFSDNSLITVEDVEFSLKVMKSDLVHPFYPSYFKDIIGAEIISDDEIKFFFSEKNRELHMISSQLPVFSKKYFEKNDYENFKENDGPVVPVGSGPYVIESFSIGKTLKYTRNPEYWAVDHPVRKGMFNFDTVILKHFKDQTVALEAFKAGGFDYMPIYIAKQWAIDLDAEKLKKKNIFKTVFAHNNNQGMQGFIMNTRRKVFENVKVREAIGYALNFSWINKSLFHNQYKRTNSFFENSELAARGLPEADEIKILQTLKYSFPQSVYTQSLQTPINDSRAAMRNNMRKARMLLEEAGWSIKNGKLLNEKGERFAFEIILNQKTFERVMSSFVKNLEKLGIEVKYRTLDHSLYTKRVQKFDYDMIVGTFAQSQSPGNEQRNFWHSSESNVKGSRNYAGVQSKAIDEVVSKVIYATTRNELITACKVLDRLLWYGYFVVPNWYSSGHRVVYNSKLQHPDKLPLYYDPMSLVYTWWDATE